MAVGSGLAAQISFIPESTFGTFIAPNRHLMGWLKGNPTFNPTRVQGGGLYAGEAAERGERYVETLREGGGTFTFEVNRRQAGIFIAHLLGSSSAAVQQGGSAAWLQTHSLAADQLGKSMVIQVGIPDAAGTSRPYTFLGSKIQKATFSCGVGESLTVVLDLDCRDLTEGQSLVAFTPLTGAQQFHFKEMGVKLGTFASEVSVTGVRKVTLTIERPLRVDRFYAGASGLKGEPITNGAVKISGSVETDYVNKADFMDRFVANTSTAMVLEWVGPIIASTFAYTTRFKLPQVFFTEGPLEVEGPDVVGVTVPFEGKFDGTNAAVIAEYMSTDTAP